MDENLYRRLAERLDAIPNGFPSTESGVELRLLEKIFTPEEANLGAVMRLTKEPAADIASRAGVDLKEAYRTLKTMARKGQILASKGEGELVFRLMPFVVGIYEEQLPRLDEELALLFEQFYQETGGGGSLIQAAPAGHRVIPGDGKMTHRDGSAKRPGGGIIQTSSVEVYARPYEKSDAKGAQSIAKN